MMTMHALRETIAALWPELNGVEIMLEMINHVGQRIDGMKMPYCQLPRPKLAL